MDFCIWLVLWLFGLLASRFYYDREGRKAIKYARNVKATAIKGNRLNLINAVNELIRLCEIRLVFRAEDSDSKIEPSRKTEWEKAFHFHDGHVYLILLCEFSVRLVLRLTISLSNFI